LGKARETTISETEAEEVTDGGGQWKLVIHRLTVELYDPNCPVEKTPYLFLGMELVTLHLDILIPITCPHWTATFL
jgi:hypothetical protein